MQNNTKNDDKYYNEQDKINILRMREVLDSLPKFCKQYFRLLHANLRNVLKGRCVKRLFEQYVQIGFADITACRQVIKRQIGFVIMFFDHFERR